MNSVTDAEGIEFEVKLLLSICSLIDKFLKIPQTPTIASYSYLVFDIPILALRMSKKRKLLEKDLTREMR